MSDAAVLAAHAEKALCSAVMWSHRMPDTPVSGDMFANEGHRAVWEAIADRFPNVDPPDVADQLARTGKLQVVGGIEAFWQVATVDQRGLPEESARQVAEWHLRRQAAHTAMQVLKASQDLSADPTALLGELDTIPRRPSRLTLHTADQIADVPPPTWLVDGHLQEGFGVIFGPWSAGKSFVAVDMAVAVASGQRWWGHPVQQGPVLYLSLEGVAGLAARIESACRARGVTMDGLHLSGDPVNLGNRTDVADVDQAVRQTGARLLIVDTWARATAGADENDNGSTGRAVEALDRIRARHGCTVLALHHARKGDSGDPRGAGSLPGAADSMWNVTKTAAGKIHVSSSKQKDGEDFRGLTFALRSEGRSATLQLIAAGKPRAEADLHMAEALDACRRGLVLKALVRSQWDDGTLERLCRHPDVREVLDDQDRPCVTAKEMPL